MIREKMVFTVGDKDFGEEIDYAELNYEDHSKFIQYVLLLFNIETIRQKGDENVRFPFYRCRKVTFPRSTFVMTCKSVIYNVV
jgi:hypothetical protein